MNFDPSASLESCWLDVFRELGEPEALLACTFTFHADFFNDLLARFAEACCEGSASNARPFTQIPIDIVCDRSRYRGHRLGFNVTLWPKNSRLFHPKILIALFRDEVVWSDGSLNLTPAGWLRNREIAILHRPRGLVLPQELRELIETFSGVAAARCILEETTKQGPADLPGQYLTSLHAPIGTRFISAAPKQVEEVHLVAPFFETEDSNEAPLDDRWLHVLAQRYPHANFHIYLPQLEAEPLRVQGCRELFDSLEQQISHPVAIHPVAAAPGALHGKVVCLVHTPKRVRRAKILVGSPNMTQAALMAPPSYGNIESAWVCDERWQDAKRIFHGLGSKARSIDEAEFVPPQISCVEAWMPLRWARYDPLRRELRVDWKNVQDARRTIVRYAGHPVLLENGVCDKFDISDGVGWLETHRRGGGVSTGRCPIEVPVELLPACQGRREERTPGEWLKMLGALWTDEPLVDNGSIVKHGKGDLQQNVEFQWSERVRDLAARMRYLENSVSDQNLNSVQRAWLLKLFSQVYDSHNPAVTSDAHEQIWRMWVRVELWHAAANIAAMVRSKTERSFWRTRARHLRRNLGISNLSPATRSQMRVVVKALAEPV